MTLRFRVVSDIGDNLSAILDEELSAMSRALRGAVDRTATALQADLRAQVHAAGLGAGLANAWRREVYPRAGRRSLRPAALVYSKATALHEAFDQGPVILPRRGAFLLIPSEAALRLGVTSTTVSRKGGPIPGNARRRLSSLEAAADRLGVPVITAMPQCRQSAPRGRGADRDRGFILLAPTRRSRSNLVALYFARRDARPVLLFTLVRQTRVPRRLDIARAAAAAETALPSAIAAALASEP
jgi:hypothetical protein